MKLRSKMTGVFVLTAGLGLSLLEEGQAQRTARPTTPPVPDAVVEHDADIKAIQELDTAFIKAYDAKDPKALGALFTAEAEIEDEDGGVTRGREAIIERFARLFEAGEGGTLTIKPAPIRFLGRELALEEGVAKVIPVRGGTPETSRYSVFYTRTDQGWLQARIREEGSLKTSAHEHLTDLEWMLGEWVNESDDAVVFTTCKWSQDGNFLLREFEVKIEGQVALSGTQRIGWDPLQKQFRTWVFDTGGGFGEGVMSRDGERWLIKATGIRSDGQPASATNVITPLGKDRIGWQTMDRTIAGESVADIDQFVIVRKPPEPGK